MYQRLGNLYSGQRIGSFESDGTSFAPPGLAPNGPGSRRRLREQQQSEKKKARRCANLTDRLAKKEAQIVKIREKIASGKAGANAARRLAKFEQHAINIRSQLTSCTAPVLNGLGMFDLSVLNPLQLGVGAVVGAGVYWFVVRPRLARAARRKRR